MEGARVFWQNDTLHVLVHHAPCDDGEAAAEVVRKYHTQALFIGLHPKDTLLTEEFRTLISGKNVMFVDICFGEDVMRAVCNVARKVLVLDHHVTNQQTMETLKLPNLHAVFVMGEAGVSLAWRFLYGDVLTMPRALYYIGLRDVWKHEKSPDAMAFCAAFARPKTPEEWRPYFIDEAHTQRVIDKGYTILSYQRQVLETMAEKVVTKEWRALRVAIVNVPFPWISELGALMCETEPARTVAVIWNKTAGEPCSVSLRSHNTLGPDVAALTKELGAGGGHAHAAAFRTDQWPEVLFQ